MHLTQAFSALHRVSDGQIRPLPERNRHWHDFVGPKIVRYELRCEFDFQAVATASVLAGTLVPRELGWLAQHDCGEECSASGQRLYRSRTSQPIDSGWSRNRRDLHWRTAVATPRFRNCLRD